MSEKPIRVQLRRTKGWKLPPKTVVVSRPSKWGNPFTVEMSKRLHPNEHRQQHQERVVKAFRAMLLGEMESQNIAGGDIALIKKELRGKNLACWCKPDEPCHADVLLEVANQ